MPHTVSVKWCVPSCSRGIIHDAGFTGSIPSVDLCLQEWNFYRFRLAEGKGWSNEKYSHFQNCLWSTRQTCYIEKGRLQIYDPLYLRIIICVFLFCTIGVIASSSHSSASASCKSSLQYLHHQLHTFRFF